MTDFREWASIPRVENTTVRITEKIDGTNAQIKIETAETAAREGWYDRLGGEMIRATVNGQGYVLMAGSRNRFLTHSTDNFSFYEYVSDHADDLADILGVGVHYGEWWGRGIQRGYGAAGRMFSLFGHWWDEPLGWLPEDDPTEFEGYRAKAHAIDLTTVPTIWYGSLNDIDKGMFIADNVLSRGSVAAFWYDNPEGYIIHTYDSHRKADAKFKRIISEGVKR